MMGKLAVRDNGTNRQFKPQIYQSRIKGDKVEFFMTQVIMIEEIIKVGIDQTVEIEEFNLVDKVEVDQGMNKIIGDEILEAMQDHIKILKDRIVENTGENYRNERYSRERGMSRSRERSFSRNNNTNMLCKAVQG